MVFFLSGRFRQVILYILNSLPPWEIYMFFLSSADFFQNQHFLKSSLRNTIRVSNNLNQEEAAHFIGPDLGPNCLQKLSAVDTRR